MFGLHEIYSETIPRGMAVAVPDHISVRKRRSKRTAELTATDAGPGQHAPKKKPRRRFYDASWQCNDCGRNSTPVRRHGPDGPRSLCNACGLRRAKQRKAQMSAKNPAQTSGLNKHSQLLGHSLAGPLGCYNIRSKPDGNEVAVPRKLGTIARTNVSRSLVGTSLHDAVENPTMLASPGALRIGNAQPTAVEHSPALEQPLVSTAVSCNWDEVNAHSAQSCTAEALQESLLRLNNCGKKVATTNDDAGITSEPAPDTVVRHPKMQSELIQTGCEAPNEHGSNQSKCPGLTVLESELYNQLLEACNIMSEPESPTVKSFTSKSDLTCNQDTRLPDSPKSMSLSSLHSSWTRSEPVAEIDSLKPGPKSSSLHVEKVDAEDTFDWVCSQAKQQYSQELLSTSSVDPLNEDMGKDILYPQDSQVSIDAEAHLFQLDIPYGC